MDIALQQDANHQFDISLNRPDIQTEKGLRTAVMISLFTDARASDDDILPGNDGDRRGHWADTYSDSSLGSKLWLLEREKELPNVLQRADEYATQALQWFIDDGIAQTVNVLTDWLAQGRMAIYVTIIKADGNTWQHTFEYELKAA
ncbi:MAG: phage GP46 family protein [Methylophaga sp.]|nr:phage GP46 family protein [Methylophaga sp.]